MAGIYFHIPFCKQACHYCDFHFSTSRSSLNSTMEAMFVEIDHRIRYLNGQEVNTIYFGGGTPSILETDIIWRLIDKVKDRFAVHPMAEITLEANPDDFSSQKLKDWKRAGVNRLSIGIQSFRDADLMLMNRAHKANEAESAVKSAQDAGLDNISIDLIYAIPGASMQHWKDNVEKAIGLQVPHISSYCLTFEEKTAFGHFQKTGKLTPTPDEAAAEQFLYLIQRLAESEIHLYEVSNFSKIGYESKHNSAYWSGSSYLGIGPSAHSFDGESRQWNIANNILYTKALQSGTAYFEREVLDERTRYNEWIMTGLRLREGVSLIIAKEKFGVDLLNEFSQPIADYLKQGYVEIENDYLRLTHQGLLLADGISSDLFILSV